MSSVRALRPMGLLEIIDQAFRLYRSDFLLFFGIAVIVYFPISVLSSVPSIGIVFSVLGTILSLLAYGALVKAVSDRYLGETTTVRDCYRFVWRRFWPFVVTMIVMYVFIVLGILAVFVGMIVFAIWCGFVIEAFVIEDKRNFAAIWRSKFLIGDWVWVKLLVIYLVISTIAYLILFALFGAAMVPTTMGKSDSPTTLMLVSVAMGLAQSFLTPIALIASVLLYYDSRIRKEGFDLQILAQELGAQLPAPAVTEPPAAPTPPGEGSV